jgi:hypothetical protein
MVAERIVAEENLFLARTLAVETVAAETLAVEIVAEETQSRSPAQIHR